ncbi:MAG: LUD domain-containing protein [Nitrososphaerales archaeon]
MTTTAREKLNEEIESAIADRAASDKMWRAMARGRNNRTEGIAERAIDVEEMKSADRRIKAGVAGDPALVERFAESVRKNGGQVYMAKTGEDAIRYVAEVAKRTATRLAVKSKSLTTEEIEFNHGMAKEGVRCVETDLGELIVQLNDEKPVHLVAPAAHLSTADIAAIFSRELNKEIPADPEAILKEVRPYLRPLFLSAQMGVTGANIGIAETGTIVVETNEGNARLVASLPRVHVVVMGMEKIIGSWADVPQLLGAHAISATGQPLTVYVSVISSHLPMAGSAEGREFHVVILDNGRSRMRDDPNFSDALNCIRCGACMNICPTYGIVGGHVFGHLYPGPIGIPWTAGVHGLENATFAHLCISCGLCKEICPVDIDMPLMIARVKEQEVARNGQPRVNGFFMSSERLARMASATAPLSNWAIRGAPSRYLMEKLVGVDRRRTLPAFTRARLRKRIAGTAQGSGERGKLVYFPDIYADYNDPELGVRAIRLLRALGYEVEVPDLKWSGMPYVSYGNLSKAAEVARFNVEALDPYVSSGYGVVSTEPTAAYMLKDLYRSLVPGEASERVAAASSGFFARIRSDLPRVELRPALEAGETVGFHIPCHERALNGGAPGMAFLERAGFKVQVVETGTCCGMAGTFGMKHGALGYDLSMAVGDRLFETIRQSGVKVVASESSVCSMQINDGTSMRVMHPLYFVEPL